MDKLQKFLTRKYYSNGELSELLRAWDSMEFYTTDFQGDGKHG